jgi:glycosyltransferase involved in cell wall biosynthesis
MQNPPPLQLADFQLVIPCFNEEATLSTFYKETEAVLINHLKAGLTYEYLFVDDGSTDGTLRILQNLVQQDNRVHYISFSRNFGKEAAMLAGLQASGGQYIVILDADLQDPPSLIPQMLEAIISGEYDCVGTRRVTRKGEPPIRSLFARMFYRLMAKITDIEVVDGARDFRLMNRKYVDAILSLQERSRFSKGIFPWVGFRIKWIEYENVERTAGTTKWSFWKLFTYSLDGIIAFSSKPLAIASILGIVFFLVAIAFIVIIIIRKIIWGDPVDGWTSTTCINLFIGGVQLFTIGILGQYLAKTYTEVKQRPYYIIKETK